MRKRLFAGMLAASMIFGTSAFAADKIDFSGYSDEELQECYQDILEEIKDRGFEKTATVDATTKFIGGVDLPAGYYVAEVIPTGDDEDYVSGNVIVKDENNETMMEKYAYSSDDGGVKYGINLHDGGSLYISIPCKLTMTAGLLFE